MARLSFDNVDEGTPNRKQTDTVPESNIAQARIYQTHPGNYAYYGESACL